MGAKKARDDLIIKFEESPSKLYGENLKLVSSESYLGDQIGFNTSESVTLTIDKRIGLAKKSVFEIKKNIEDSRSKVTGGIKTGLLLWNSCIVPFLMNNCSSWIKMK